MHQHRKGHARSRAPFLSAWVPMTFLSGFLNYEELSSLSLYLANAEGLFSPVVLRRRAGKSVKRQKTGKEGTEDRRSGLMVGALKTGSSSGSFSPVPALPREPSWVPVPMGGGKREFRDWTMGHCVVSLNKKIIYAYS